MEISAQRPGLSPGPFTPHKLAPSNSSLLHMQPTRHAYAAITIRIRIRSGAGAGPSPARQRAAFPSSCLTSAPSATAATPVLNEFQLQQRVSHMELGGMALGNLAVYMMHLGLPEGSCWQLL
ncbi:MAG: hypothetical protein WDW38_002332 [Sanguina aurantia]